MPTALEMTGKRNQTWERMKEIYDRAESEKRDLTAEESANWDAANAELGVLDRQIQRALVMERTPATPEERSRMPGRESSHIEPREAIASPEYRRAYANWLRFGEQRLSPEDRAAIQPGYVNTRDGELRALSTLVGASGAYIISPNDFAAQIERAMLFYGGMREAGTVVQTENGADLPFPVSNDTANVGEIVAENGTVSEQDVTFGLRTLKAFMYSSKIVRVPFQLMQDAAFDVEAFLAAVFAERIGRIQNTHFTVGVGSSQPLGLTTVASGSVAQGVAGATGLSTSVNWDSLIQLIHSIDPAYRSAPGVRFMFHDNTLRDIRQQKDGNGNYLWQPGVTAGVPSAVLGYPYTVNNDVPVMAASINSVWFGDMKRYLIREVRGFTLVRLEELYAGSLQVGFFAFSRADGAVINAGGNPIKYFTNSAS